MRMIFDKIVLCYGSNSGIAADKIKKFINLPEVKRSEKIRCSKDGIS